MSPEQVQARTVDGRADIFALGVVLYEAVSGNQPFAGRTVHHTLDRILSEEPVPLDEVRLDIRERVQWVIEKCLHKDATRRYQHADDLAGC